MIAVLAVAAITANAQVWIGGEIGLTTSKTTNDGEDVKSGTDITVAPEIGYSINDKWDIAVALNYTHSSATTNIYGPYNYETQSNSFSINPYVRYTFFKAGNFSAFLDGGVGYGFTHFQGADDDVNDFFVAIKPGFAYKVSPKVSLVAHFGDLSYDHSWVGDYKTNKFGIGLNNTVSFGAYYAF